MNVQGAAHIFIGQIKFVRYPLEAHYLYLGKCVQSVIIPATPTLQVPCPPGYKRDTSRLSIWSEKTQHSNSMTFDQVSGQIHCRSMVGKNMFLICFEKLLYLGWYFIIQLHPTSCCHLTVIILFLHCKICSHIKSQPCLPRKK